MFLDRLDNIEIELTTLCNARCPMCSRQHNETSIPDKGVPNVSLTKEQVAKLQLPNNISLTVSGNFGDPIANIESYEILDILTDKCNQVVVDTNASLKTNDYWIKLGKLSKEKNLIVVFSIDGLEDTNSIYRINTNFKKIINNAKLFISSGGNAVWKYIVFAHNEHQVDEARALATDLGFTKFKTEHSTRWLSKSFVVEGNTISPSTLALKKENKFKYNIKEGNNIMCRSQGKNMLFITADFKLMPCSYFNVDRWKNPDFLDYWKDIQEKNGHDFNDLNIYTIEEILQTDYFKTSLMASWTDNTCWKSCKRFCNSDVYWNKTEIRSN